MSVSSCVHITFNVPLNAPGGVEECGEPGGWVVSFADKNVDVCTQHLPHLVDAIVMFAEPDEITIKREHNE